MKYTDYRGDKFNIRKHEDGFSVNLMLGGLPWIMVETFKKKRKAIKAAKELIDNHQEVIGKENA